jgi:hypothetical protein
MISLSEITGFGELRRRNKSFADFAYSERGPGHNSRCQNQGGFFYERIFETLSLKVKFENFNKKQFSQFVTLWSRRFLA